MNHLSIKKQAVASINPLNHYFFSLKGLILFTLLGVIFFFGGCKPETINADFGGSSAGMVTTTILGKVVDESGAAIVGINIICGTTTVIPDEHGIFILKDISVPSDKVYIKAVKEGYFTSSKIVSPTADGISRVALTMVAVNPNLFYQTETGGVVNASSMLQLTFKPGSVINQLTGAYYQGKVMVALRYFNPTSTDYALLAPGNLHGLTFQNEKVLVKSYGTATIALYSVSGEPLQLLPGTTAVLSYTIPDKLAVTAPATITLWSFNEEKGCWVEEATALKETNKYVGAVNHFSAWSVNTTSSSSVIRGRVLACDGTPVAGVKVNIDNQQVITDETGFYYQTVKAKSNGIIEVLASANSNLFYSQAQPYQSVSTGDTVRVANIAVACPTRLLGSLINCDSVAVNGLIYAEWANGSGFTYSTNSSFALPVPAGQALKLTIIVDNKFEKLDIPALSNLEQYKLDSTQVCDLVDTVGIENSFYLTGANFLNKFVRLRTPSSLINFVQYDEAKDTTYVKYATVDYSNDSCKLSFRFKGKNIGSSQTLKKEEFKLIYKGNTYEGDKDTVALEQYGEIGQFVIGTFGGTIRNTATGTANVKISQGRFKLLRQ